ncbi:MAG: ribosomal maturation YjgA family protein [Planctomycetota bacterium]
MAVNEMSGVVLFFSRRKWILLSLCIVTPAAFLFKSYSGPAHKWFNDYGAGVLYEVFWCLVVFFLLPARRYITAIAVSVFATTCALEVLQLWHPWFLEQARSTFWGRALLGTTFVWWDFPHYVLGCLLGWVWMRALSNRFGHL